MGSIHTTRTVEIPLLGEFALPLPDRTVTASRGVLDLRLKLVELASGRRVATRVFEDQVNMRIGAVAVGLGRVVQRRAEGVLQALDDLAVVRNRRRDQSLPRCANLSPLLAAPRSSAAGARLDLQRGCP
jgi:hypothetical protein